MNRTAARRAICDFVDGDHRCSDIRNKNEVILQEYKKILARRDRIAYLNWPQTETSFELAALLYLIDIHFCGRGTDTYDWTVQGPVHAILTGLGLQYKVELRPLASNVAGSTSWGKTSIVVEINSALYPYLNFGSAEFYKYNEQPQECLGCKQRHATINSRTRQTICPFLDPVLRANHVGNINCSRVGCLLETLLHEYCHVLEFAHRCATKPHEPWGQHNAEDDKNTLFLRIREKFTDHTSSFNNLLHSVMGDLSISGTE